MTPEQITSLVNELINDPEKIGYGPWIPDGPGHLVDLLNAPTQTMVRERFMTARGILAALPLNDAATFLETLEALGPVNPVVKWGLRFLTADPGIDVGHANTRLLLAGLVQAGALTQELTDKVKDLAVQPASRVEVLFGAGTVVTQAHVLDALTEV
jgi:hypothetical protein